MKNHLLQSWETNETLRFWNNKDTTTNAPSQGFPLFSISRHWRSLHHSEYQPTTTQIKMHSKKPKNLTFPTEIPDLENSNRLTAFKLWKRMIPIPFFFIIVFLPTVRNYLTQWSVFGCLRWGALIITSQ